MTPWGRALAAVLGPLEFAARDDFAHADRVRDLESSVVAGCHRALELSIPRDARAALEAVARLFSKPLEGEARASAVKRAEGRLAPFADPDFVDVALARSPSVLPGVGPKTAQALERRGFGRVVDLLLHLPTRYDDRRRLVGVSELEVGRRSTFVAKVLQAKLAPRRGRGGRPRRVLEATVGDDTGRVVLTWFHGGEALKESLAPGTALLVTGDVRRYRFEKQLLHPEIELLEATPEDPEALLGLGEVVPDYPTPDRLQPRTVRRAVQHAVDEYADLMASFLPPSLAEQRQLPETAEALRQIHRPGVDGDVKALTARATPAHERLILEELYLLEIGLALRRTAEVARPGIAIASDGPRTRAAAGALPFRLTGAQRRVWGEIQRDLSKPHPMHRLLQGDVGSGKTAVAFLAALAAAESGCQSALLAPTELLAEQHVRTLSRLIEAGHDATRLRLGLLTASVPRPEAEALRADLAAGRIELAVGTHALLQQDVRFSKLALGIVDEQHRFGVMQRGALLGKAPKGLVPHVLVMTATPIPRTLAMTAWGELELSVIDELPPGRAPVATELLRTGEGERIVAQIRQTVSRGEQVYVVYPLVEESEKVDLRAATVSAERIAAAFPDLRVDLVHGRLDSAARSETMARFERGETQILVSTSVVEVGVDVANATLMIVEHAERFGLAQLHQLRGRVGRGERPGACLLVARGGGEDSEARLRAMLETTDGFKIADADLRIRGPGEFLGTRQSGFVANLHVADLVGDARLVAVAREAAFATVEQDPGLSKAPELARAVQVHWGKRLALSQVG